MALSFLVPGCEDPKGMLSNRGWVYLISFVPYTGDFRHKCYKIGFTANAPEERLRQLDSVLPGYVQLEHAIKTDSPQTAEWFWHNLFDSQRISKVKEWFELEQEQIEDFLKVSEMKFTPSGLNMIEDEVGQKRVQKYRQQLAKAKSIVPDD